MTHDARVLVWRVELGGREHVARPVSNDEVRAWSEAHAAAGRLPDTEWGARLQDAALLRLLRRALPWEWRYLFRPQEDPLWHFVRLPDERQEAIVESFFVYRGILRRGTPPTPRGGSSSGGTGPSGPSATPPASGRT